MFENSENRKKLKSLKIFEKIPFEFKDGWTNLVFQLGKDITELCELTNCELPIMLQIKEKMGTLRFYYDDSKFKYPDAVKNSIFALVSRAVGKSANICETCGKWGELRVDKGYWFVSCDEHKRNSITAEEWKDLDKKQREDLENEKINTKPYKPLKFEDIKSPILKRKIMEKVACFEAVLLEQKEKNDFYRERIYDDLSGFIYATITRDTDKRAFLLRLENLIKKIDKTYKKLVPKYKEYIRAFDLKKVVPVENVKYEDFKVVQNLSNFDLLDYSDFIKSGRNTPQKVLFNLNTMSKKQIELTMYIRFMNSLSYHVKINFIHDLKSDGFDLFVALNDDVDGMLLLVTTNWYLKFFDEDEFNVKWRAFKKLRVADYINANCLSLDKNKVFEKQEIEKSRDYEFPQIPKDMLFIFENNEDKTIIFEKKWMRLYNSMFWSSPQKFELPIKNIVAIALSNNPSFQTFLDLYLLFGRSLFLYVYDIFENEEIGNIKKYMEFYERCFDIFGVSFKNRKKILQEKIPIVEQDFIKIIYSKLFNVDLAEARSSCPFGLLYLKSVKENKKLIKREIEEYMADCFLADFKSLQQ